MKTAYVLSGGGAKGSLQVGVMKKLHEAGVKPDVIYGTSVGSINAAAYAFAGIEEQERLWRNIEGPKWYKFWTPSADILSFNWGMLALCADGIYNLNPLRDSLNKIVTPTAVAQCEAVSCRVSLNTGKVDYLSSANSSSQEVIEGVLGSSAIPGVMSPNGEWVDGGVREVVPLKRAIEDGATNIYVILCNPFVQNPQTQYDVKATSIFLKFYHNLFRAIDGIMEHEVFVDDINLCLVRNTMNGYQKINLTVYAPTTAPMDTLDFDPKKIAAAIDLGYKLAPLAL